MEWQKKIEEAYVDRTRLKDPAFVSLLNEVIQALDSGQLRVAEPLNGEWVTHAWVKKAVLLCFSVWPMREWSAGEFCYHDKVALKSSGQLRGVRAVPGSIVRVGAHVAPGAVLMPSFVNIGAYVGAGTMVDTWATVGSCAQVGSGVHLSGGVGIGGVLEPPQASPVVIEDHCFVGSRAIVVEGVRVGTGAVLGANVVLTASTKIIDVSGSKPTEYQGFVPPRSVVIPGMRTKDFPAGPYGVPCALIIGQRKASTDEKTSLNDALRDFQVAV
jgi:2,3,4,5-tetrahydropyridine-2-carboxylate N-succinyltransferase